MSAWTEHVARWKDCTDCPLCQQRDRIVLARGSVPCDVLFIGEAPGASEDALGQPFVGPAGKLLDQIIERALPPTVRYALTNLVCCFPADAKARGENEPEVPEIEACRPRLVEFVNICQPRLIVCVGQLAARHVPRAATTRYCEVVHPAAMKRMPLAQQGMAAQKAVVIIRCAVEDVLVWGSTTFTKWGDEHAGIQTRTVRQQLDTTYRDDDIPF
jgi:uracil-DNA glycosylase family 4